VLVGIQTADRDIGRVRLRFVLDAHLDSRAGDPNERWALIVNADFVALGSSILMSPW
jgi:hypothetical protein